jgi:Ni,Fe-hydrogenase III large subunit
MLDLLATIPESALVKSHAPWPRLVVEPPTWIGIAREIAAGRATMLGLWGELGRVHLALMSEDDSDIRVVSLDCPQGRFPSVAATHAPAQRLERAMCDLFGLVADGAPDDRPWLDHGRWGLSHPLGQAQTVESAPASYAFLSAEGEGLHQIPVGPVHAGIIEPGHFRFTVNGETVVRLEARLGYVHKGVEGLMAGAPLDRAAKLAGRVSGDSTVAYGWAFAQAVEAALRVDAPPRAHYLRAAMAELERIANHLGDIGAICNDASFSLLQAHFSSLRERVLRSAERCFGHRLMRDVVLPGGVANDIGGAELAVLRDLVELIRRRFDPLIKLYDETASLQDRTVGTGILQGDLAVKFAAGGYVGRASGRAFDARRLPGCAPYGELSFEIPTLTAGDVNSRVWIRIREIEQSLSLLDQILGRLPAGPLRVALPSSGEAREGMALVEGFRGDILVWLRLAADGSVDRCHLRDPSWFQWPLLEAAIEGNIVADFPLCNKSFNCSYSGHDL